MIRLSRNLVPCRETYHSTPPNPVEIHPPDSRPARNPTVLQCASPSTVLDPACIPLKIRSAGRILRTPVPALFLDQIEIRPPVLPDSSTANCLPPFESLADAISSPCSPCRYRSRSSACCFESAGNSCNYQFP